jgi:hypothetical protein
VGAAATRLPISLDVHGGIAARLAQAHAAIGAVLMSEAAVAITVATPIEETPRVQQIRGIFDLPADAGCRFTQSASYPLGERPWNIGLITGPSGCGKTTLARHLWPEAYHADQEWPATAAIVDAFPEVLSIKQVVEILSSVGFSSPPAWLRPYHVLSTGQQFRADLALAIARCMPLAALQTHTPLVVFDEFTSTVDRTVAQIGSAAVAKAIRKYALQFVAVTCHQDVIDWLQPDWVLDPSQESFQWRSLQRRPGITLEIVRCRHEAWPLFAPHHYLSHKLMHNATCFLATLAACGFAHSQPVAFSAWLPFYGGGPPTRREHRTVCLPDYQGVGIGNALSDTIAAAYKSLGYRATSTTTHPAMIAARLKSPRWKMTRAPGLAAGGDLFKHAETRLTAGFEYMGPPLAALQAKALCAG